MKGRKNHRREGGGRVPTGPKPTHAGGEPELFAEAEKKKRGGKIHSTKSKHRLDRSPRGKSLARRAAGGTVEQQNVEPPPGASRENYKEPSVNYQAEAWKKGPLQPLRDIADVVRGKLKGGSAASEDGETGRKTGGRAKRRPRSFQGGGNVDQSPFQLSVATPTISTPLQNLAQQTARLSGGLLKKPC